MVALALFSASLALLGLLHANLLRNAEGAAEQQARSVAVLAAQGQLTEQVPLAHGADFIQVVSADGRVLAASQNLAGQPAVSHTRSVGTGAVVTTWDGRHLGEEHRQRVVAVPVTTPVGRATVYAGTSLRDADAADGTATAALATGGPLLLLIVALATWWTIGRALRPVEGIRAEVAEITDRHLHRRVPLPGTQDEVARLAVTMNATLDRLEASGVRQRRFIADASHELRSPIAVLRTQLEVALAHPDGTLWPELVGGALEDTVRLQELAADLLLLARLDAAGPVAARPVDLTELFRQALAARSTDRVPVQVLLEPGISVSGNRTWLTRLLTNLLDNAQRYADRSITVSLRTGSAARTVVLEVTDDGPGIPAADRERVFERFTRLDDARSRDLGGAGLGLAIARDIAAHHGGTLCAEDRLRGTRLVARIPSCPPERT